MQAAYDTNQNFQLKDLSNKNDPNNIKSKLARHTN